MTAQTDAAAPRFTAADIGAASFEASVSCGTWCLGGCVVMSPTTHPEFTSADEVWVRGDAVIKLIMALNGADIPGGGK